MNDAYYTQEGERPELAALEVNMPEGYIGSKIMPITPVADKTGYVYYATLTADDAAQTSRTASAAPDATAVTTSNTTFSCLERVKRASIVPDEVKQMGGIDKADRVGAMWAKRQVMNALETSIAAELLGLSASKAWDAAKCLKDTQVALDSIRRYEGRTALVAGTKTLRIMVQNLLADDAMGSVFSRVVSGTSPAVAVEGLGLKTWLNGLAMFLGVDEVLAGDDAIWALAGTNEGKFAYVKLDASNDQLSHKWMPVFGKTFQFMPDGKNPWVIQSVPDRVNVRNLWDAYLYYDTTALNTGAAYVFEGVTV